MVFEIYRIKKAGLGYDVLVKCLMPGTHFANRQHYCLGACQISKWPDDVITQLSALRLCKTKDAICDTESVESLINFHVQILSYFAILPSFYCYTSTPSRNNSTLIDRAVKTSSPKTTMTNEVTPCWGCYDLMVACYMHSMGTLSNPVRILGSFSI